ncbi:MAG: hypothetical protein GXP49_17665 [Deltaproteobacteria bacterium]|nr:hypothetical protein [Deltaproteobacteria bacterium]
MGKKEKIFTGSTISLLCTLIFTLSYSVSSLAWEPDPRRNLVPDARPLAMGEAFRAISVGNSALYYNPAGLAFFPTYSIEANYTYQSWVSGHVAQVSIADTKSNPYVGAVVGYSYGHFDGNPLGKGDKFSYHSTRLGLCFPLVKDTLALGLGSHYMNSKKDDHQADNFLSLDVSLLAKIGHVVSLAVVGHNLTNPASQSAPMSIGSGVAFQPFGSLLLAFDVVADFQSAKGTAMEYHTGAEYQILFGQGKGGGQVIALRGGYIYDDVRDRQFVSGGLAYVNPGGALEFSFRQGVAGSGTSDKDSIFSFSLKLFL